MKDYSKAIKFLKIAKKQGLHEADILLADSLISSDYAQNRSEAIKLYSEAGSNGISDGFVKLGELYENEYRYEEAALNYYKSTLTGNSTGKTKLLRLVAEEIPAALYYSSKFETGKNKIKMLYHASLKKSEKLFHELINSEQNKELACCCIGLFLEKNQYKRLADSFINLVRKVGTDWRHQASNA